MALNALTLLRYDVTRAESFLSEVFAKVTADQLVWLPKGATTNPIGTTFLHVYHVEDRAIHRLLGDKPTVFEAKSWQDRLGYDPTHPWAPLATPPDPVALRTYAAEVFADTQSFLDGLAPEALEQEISSPRGNRPMYVSLTLSLVIHKLMHMGEISALLGCQGVKGFPV
ncbi:MAG TPA: DinB family protein [Chloroflexota bacterium]|nr:DinB family protein [Chloroflexota bacterium]